MSEERKYREYLAEVWIEEDGEENIILQKEIIRCEECKYFSRYREDRSSGCCTAGETYCEDMDYCNHGERKEDEKDD